MDIKVFHQSECFKLIKEKVMITPFRNIFLNLMEADHGHVQGTNKKRQIALRTITRVCAIIMID
jgi:hypothetical protein